MTERTDSGFAPSGIGCPAGAVRSERLEERKTPLRGAACSGLESPRVLAKGLFTGSVSGADEVVSYGHAQPSRQHGLPPRGNVRSAFGGKRLEFQAPFSGQDMNASHALKYSDSLQACETRHSQRNGHSPFAC